MPGAGEVSGPVPCSGSQVMDGGLIFRFLKYLNYCNHMSGHDEVWDLKKDKTMLLAHTSHQIPRMMTTDKWFHAYFYLCSTKRRRENYVNRFQSLCPIWKSNSGLSNSRCVMLAIINSWGRWMGGWRSLDGLEMEMENVMPTKTTTLSYGQSGDYTDPPG